MPRYNPDRNERAANRARHANQHAARPQSSEFLELIQLQLQAANKRDRARSQHDRYRRPERSRSRSPHSHTSSFRRRSRSPRREIARLQAARTVTPPPPPPFQQDLDPRRQVGQTARPSPEAEESVLGWASYAEVREQNRQRPLADSYRPNYASNPTQNTDPGSRQQSTPSSNARGRAEHHYRGRGHRGRRSHRGQSGRRSLFDRINI
jgi:hypothetical protein